MRLKAPEKKSIKFRRSIFVQKDIKKGEHFSEKNLKNDPIKKIFFSYLGYNF